MRTSVALRRGVGVLVLGAWAVSVGATPSLGKQAQAVGLPAKDCIYCHTFASDHQWARARSMGISPGNCVACHGSKLPADKVYNDRGKWLIAERERRKAKEVDGAWLKDYVEPAKPGSKGSR